MTTLPLVRPHLQAVRSLLEADGLLVTDTDEWPDGAGWQGGPGQSDFVGFVRVTDMAGPAPTGGIDGVRSDMSLLVHIQCVGATKDQANKMRDRVHGLMVSGTLAVPGRALLQKPYQDMSGEVVQDADVDPPVQVGWDRYRLPTTPA